MKIIVAHPAQQHSYRTAIALHRESRLDRYLTTVYRKRFSLTAVAAALLRGKLKEKALGRTCPELPDAEVVQFCEAEGLLKLFAMHVPCVRKYYQRLKYATADRFAKRVAGYAIKHRVDAVITYDDCSPLLFEILRERAPAIRRITDMSSASLLFLRKIYEADTEKAPAFANRLRTERSIVWDDAVLQRAERELQATQDFLVPSAFVAKSLKDYGIAEKQIHICPYGVDTGMFSQKTYSGLKNRPLECVYVGGVKELKGIYYLLEAFRQLPQEKAQLTVVGAANTEDDDLQPYLKHVTFTGPVLHTEVSAILKRSDVFILPSLGEGLSLSALEAAGTGLPLIVSENSGVNDVMEDGREGFIIPVQSTTAILEKIEYLIQNPGRLETMGLAAREMAEKYSWENYYARLNEVMSEMLEQSESWEKS